MLQSEDSREISRCRAMMLRHKGDTIKDLADISDVDRLFGLIVMNPGLSPVK